MSAITLIVAPESTIEFKIGYHHGKTGKPMTSETDWTWMHRDNYAAGMGRRVCVQPSPSREAPQSAHPSHYRERDTMSTNNDSPAGTIAGVVIAAVLVVVCVIFGLQADHDCTAAGGHTERIVNENRPTRTIAACLDDDGKRIRP